MRLTGLPRFFSATFAFVLMAELRYRRAKAGVVPFLAYENSTGNLHSYALMNIGSDAAILFSTEATSSRVPQGNTFSVLRPGEDKTLTVWSDSIEEDWVLFDWIDPVDTRFVVYQWFPMATSELGAEWQKQLDENNVRYRRRWRRFRRKRQSQWAPRASSEPPCVAESMMRRKM